MDKLKYLYRYENTEGKEKVAKEDKEDEHRKRDKSSKKDV